MLLFGIVGLLLFQIVGLTMRNYDVNSSLLSESPPFKKILPHLEGLDRLPFVFTQDFGLEELPREPGVLMIRGPRQYGKSTWLEQQIQKTIEDFGPGSALYLNGDEIIDSKDFIEELRKLIPLFSGKSLVRRLFIDEITAIASWEKALKRLLDSRELKDILVVSTGSKASDLRRGTERLPGRKGRLERTNYIFTPISYKEFREKCAKHFKEDTLNAYILSGGSPVSANALASERKVPEYASSIITDWIYGEFAASGRSRSHLLAVLQSLYRMAPNPIGQAKLARESGLSSNTTAQGYIDLLSDLMTVIPSFPYDTGKKITLFRKACKYHFVNVFAAICWHTKKPRTLSELKALNTDLGALWEWVVAQELWRRFCIQSSEMPDNLLFWQSKDHEIDFILPNEDRFIEVKVGSNSPADFQWFFKAFPKKQLTVIGKNRMESLGVKCITLEDFLLEKF